MTRFLYDTNVFVYALGDEHPLKEPCRAILARAQTGLLRGEASADLVQEFTHQRLRQTGDRADAAAWAREVARACILHALEPGDIDRALGLFVASPRLSTRDSFFAAVALGRGIHAILSADRGFDDVPGLERVDPADGAAVDRLTA